MKAFKPFRSPDAAVIKIKAEKRGLGSLRTLLTVFLIFLQLVILVSLYFTLAEVFPWYVGLSLGLSVACCIYTLSSDRSPSSKAVWVFILLIFFFVGHILFILTDEKVFFYRSKKRYAKVFAKSEKYAGKSCPPSADKRCAEDCAYLEKVGRFSAYGEGNARYFSSGGQFFDAVIEDLRRAEKFIFIEFFIIADGRLFERFLKELSRKAAGGVEVCVIYDDMGSYGKLSYKSKSRMKKRGIKLMSFNRLLPVIDVGLNYRDHRKIVVIDGKIAYTGGANLADEYTNDKRMHGYWKDGGVRVEGGAAKGFALMFLRQWEFLTRKSVEYENYLSGAEQSCAGESVFVPFACGLDYDKPVAKELLLNVIAKAQDRLYIMTPYLVPDDSIFNMLANKAASGVDVKIILPAVPDKAVVYKVTLNNAHKLAERGVKIYLMRDSFVHSKIMLADYCAVIGSVNIDMRSFYQQFESALYTNDATVMDEVSADFTNTLEECQTLSERKSTPLNRVSAGLLKIISPLM